MMEAVRHRGPDGDGAEKFFDERLWLGHRRLSIVDLSEGGRQPMSYAAERYWISYNGEVYNYLELRMELERAGHRFRSTSDTEVLLAAYVQWGSGCLQHFNGMFALAILDLEKKELFIARDRFGVKPLYYWRSPQGFVAFGSEIKQFTVLPGWRARINPQRVYDFLNFGLTDHTEETLFEGVFQIRRAEAVCLQLEDFFHSENSPGLPAGRISPTTWYNLKPGAFGGDQVEATSEFLRLLRHSVELRLRADVPVGSCLSGGLDSSSIVCLMSDLLQEAGNEGVQKTFSSCAELKKFDEREFVEEVVNARKLCAYYTIPTVDGLFAELENLTWLQDEPFGSTGIYAQWSVFKLAAEMGVKVMLDGQGGDEQLAGYPVFFFPLFANLFRSFRWVALWQEIRAARQVHGFTPAFIARSVGNVLLCEKVRQQAKRWLGKDGSSPAWLNMSRLGAIPMDCLASRGAMASSVVELSHSQLTATNLQMLLHWEDRNSMAHSVEARVPFLDYRLVECVLGLPDDFKISKGTTKLILREAMKGILPESIRMRMDKMGFATPEKVWMRETRTQRFRKELEDAIAVSQGILNLELLDKFDRIVEGKEAFTSTIWRLISFGYWLRRFHVTV